MLIFVAPYHYPEEGRGSLGAARKIELLLQQLNRLDSDIIFVNTSGCKSEFRHADGTKKRVGKVDVREVRPPALVNERVTKIFSLFRVASFARYIEKNFGRPRFAWLYNGYAFESLFGRAAKRIIGCPVVLEFEDWHFARSRGLNPKPILDWAAWRLLRQHVDISFAVNRSLAKRLSQEYGECHLLPGIVSELLAKQERTPFSGADGIVKVGYFGQLNAEKGADLVLQLCERLPFNYQIHVTGIGPLFDDFSKRAKVAGGRLFFHGSVESDQLYKIIQSCDVILNPHMPLIEDRGGLFPFKVIEAISSGRLLISTELPRSGFEEILSAVRFVSRDVDSFVQAITSAKTFYLESREQIFDAAAEVYERFGDGCVVQALKRAGIA